MPLGSNTFRLFGDLSTGAQLRLAHLALAATIDGVLVHRPDGTILLFNDAMARKLGYTPDEFAALPKYGWTKVPADKRAARTEALRRHGQLTFESTVLGADGQVLHQEIHARYVQDPEGDLIVSVCRDTTKRVRAEAQLRQLAYHDALTGLANRAAFSERLDEMLGAAQRHGDLLGVIYLDLDDFKLINDEFGHETGDHVLVACAHRLEGALRQEDVVARLGGDEFVVVVPRLDKAPDLGRIVEKLMRAIRKPVTVGRAQFELSAAAGTAIYDPLTDDARTLLARADDAMYAAKALARGVL